jgi:hypothetical protein
LGPSVFDIHFDFRLTATSSHHLPLPTMKTQLLKSPLGDVMLPLYSTWVAMSLGDQLHMLQPKFVNLFFLMFLSQLTTFIGSETRQGL